MAIALSKTKSYSDERPMKIRDSLGSIDELSGRVAESRSVPGSWSRGRDRKYSTLADLFCVKDNETELESVITDNHSSPKMPVSPPPPPFVLNFTNLHYSVKRKQGGGLFGGRRSRLQAADHVEDFQHCGNQKIVLNDISGEARDGEILAVMGHSGSGKSTLIDALAQRISKDSLKGSMTLNHEPLQSKVFRSISAYVMQDDLLFPMLTVEETLNFAAEFRLPSSFTKEQKRARVAALLDQLGLRSAANTIIGDEGHRGVSGGERRRVSIGIDIIHDPILLFLDEPTSGLDSTSAFMVVKVLQRIARTGSIIVMSIHQPSYRILGILDKIMLLAHGHTVFSGRPQNLGNYFAAFGRPVPENENSTEFALDLVRELEAASGGVKPLLEFYKSWSAVDPENNTLNVTCMPLKDAIGASIARGKLVADTNENGIPVANFANKPLKEMLVLTSRAFTNLRRTPELFLMRLGTVMFTGFMLATIFWKLDASPKGIRERLGVFAFAMSTTFYTCADALPVFLQERYIFMRETAYNAYRRSSYVLAHAIVSMPSLVILAAAFASVTFWTVGLAGGTPGFFFFFLMMLASFWTANSFVTFLSGVVSNLMIAYTIVVALLAYFLLMSGFFITRDRIPAYWIWFHYISLIKYPYEGVLLNEFGRSDACFARGSEVFEGTPIQALPPQMQQSFLGLLRTTTNIDITPTTCVTTGRDVLHAQGVTELSKWSCLVITVAWGVFFRVFFYVSLVLGSKNKRH